MQGDMLALIVGAVAALVGILVGFWLRGVCETKNRLLEQNALAEGS